VPDKPSSSAQPSAGLLASYQALHDVARMLLGSATRDELLTRITRELQRLVPYDFLTIYEIDNLHRQFLPLHVVDRFERHLEDSAFPMGSGFTGRAVDQRAAINLPRADLAPGGELVPGTSLDPEALVIVPMMVRGEPIATLNVSRAGEDCAFSDGEFELIQRFADLAALALDNTQIREQLTREAQTDWLTGLWNHRMFQEHLRDEVERAHRYRRNLSLIVFDLDDFKLLNDVHGHQDGDVVLASVADVVRDLLRHTDMAFRPGGEEFALLLPETPKRAARAVADRLCAQIRAMPAVRPVTVSCGVASFPVDAANATELHGAADAALYAAKDSGKNRASSYSAAGSSRRRDPGERRQEGESLTQLKRLGEVATKLNLLNDVERIANTIVQELRTMVDYHDARVYLVTDGGRTLEPMAWSSLHEQYDSTTADALRCRLGEGVTGTAALRGQTLNVGDAQSCEFAMDIAGTDDIEESLLAVPMRYEGATVGVIVLSKLGKNQFTSLSERLLELLAAQAAVAFENARLLAAERRAAAVAQALLEIATRAAADPSPARVADLVAGTVLRLTGAAGVAVVVADPGDARQRILASRGESAVRSIALVASRAAEGTDDVAVFELASLPAVSVDSATPSTHIAIAPLHAGTLVVLGDPPAAADVETLAAVARQATLALRNAELLAGRGPAADTGS